MGRITTFLWFDHGALAGRQIFWRLHQSLYGRRSCIVVHPVVKSASRGITSTRPEKVTPHVQS